MKTATKPFRHSLGIMTTRSGEGPAAGEAAVRAEEAPPFGSQRFYRRLCLAGQRAGMCVFVFTPQGIDWLSGTTEGFTYEQQSKQWRLGNYPLPDAVYDRCFFTNRSQYVAHRTAVRKLQEEHHALLLGFGLKGKQDVQRMLERDGRFAGYLPRTVAMRSMQSVADWLLDDDQLIMKPQAGSQGRGVLLVRRERSEELDVSSTNASLAGLARRCELGQADASGTAESECYSAARAVSASTEHIRGGGAHAAACAAALRPAGLTERRERGGTEASETATQGDRRGARSAMLLRASGEPRRMLRVCGRDAHNRRIERTFADEAALLLWLRRFTAMRPYLQQQYLLLQTRAGDSYDVRSLVQKDGAGTWSLTGMAVRRGQKGSLTSNLHGGGTVEPVGSFLAKHFSLTQAHTILNELYRLSRLIPEALESRHGRLVELGIDFGIDTSGQLWILEVNSKPGRSILSHLDDPAASIRAVTNPVHYAKYLLTSRSAVPAYAKHNTRS